MGKSSRGVSRHHASVGIAAAVFGAVLGIGVVYWDAPSAQAPLVQAAGACPQGNYNCRVGERPPEGESGPCVKGTKLVKVVNGGSCPCTCEKGPGPLEQMCDSTLVCDGKALEGKPKEAPKEAGGMPKLPELPKGGGGGGGQPPPKQDEECQKEPKPEHCESSVSRGLLDTLVPQSVKNLFSSDSTGGTEEAAGSAFDRLRSFFTNESLDTSETTSSQNPTEAEVTPVVVGSSAGQINPRGGAARDGMDTNANTGIGPNAAVTGFGANEAVDTGPSTGPILSAIRSVTMRIQEILSSLF